MERSRISDGMMEEGASGQVSGQWSVVRAKDQRPEVSGIAPSDKQWNLLYTAF